MDAHIEDGEFQPQSQHHNQVEIDGSHQHQGQVVGGADPGPAEALGEGQEEGGQHSGIEDVTAEDIADDQFRLTEQGGGGDTGEEFRQRGDGSQDHTADEGAGDAGAFVDDVHIIGELDGEAHHNYSEDQISDNDHRLYLPVISNGRKSISFRSRCNRSRRL